MLYSLQTDRSREAGRAMMRRRQKYSGVGVALLLGVTMPYSATQSPEPAADRSGVRFTITEAALLDWLKAATPYTFSVGNQVLKIDLTLSEPKDLRLQDSKASFQVRLKGTTIPVDQVVAPVFLLRHDDSLNKYFVVISSLPVLLPGLGTVDLKDSFPKFELPELIQDIWKFSDRAMAVNLDIRRIAVLDHAIEIGANVIFTPAAPVGTRGTR